MAAMFFISPVIFFLIWPWLWHEPLTRTAHYLALQVDRISIPLYYFGTVYKESGVPWHYPIIMTLVTLPPVVFILAMLGAFKIVKHRFMDSNGTLIILNIAACIGVFILPQAEKYDGVRLFLPAFPFIACLSGISLNNFLTSPLRVGATLVVARTCKIISCMFKKPHSILVVGILLLAVSALPLINISPYYLSYYNVFTGGVKGAEHHGFETTYWGDTCTEDILDYLNKNACQNARVAFYPVGCNVVTLYQLTGRLRSDIERVSLEEWETMDYLVLNCRQGFFDERLWEVYREKEPEYATTFQGVLLTAIYKKIPR